VLVEDTRLDEHKRWVVLAPPGAQETGLLLGEAATADQRERIGGQTGGRAGLFLSTSDFDRDYERMRAECSASMAGTRPGATGRCRALRISPIQGE
jgi:hypothetical protein